MKKSPYNLKVLYVEDDCETLEEMSLFLQRRFQKVFIAPEGETGFKLFLKHLPEIVIADLLMEGMGGIGMLSKIRETGSRCSILVTSAMADSDTILKTVDIGIDKYIIKPIKPETLDKALDKIAENIINGSGFIFSLGHDAEKKLKKELRLAIAAFIKRQTGKGPENIGIIFSDNRIEIEITGFQTIYDTTLLRDKRNHAFVEQSRHLLYKSIKFEMEKLIGGIISADVSLTSVEISPQTNQEICIFNIASE